MIKTLRITSMVAVVLSLVFFTFSVVFALASDEDIEKLLASQSAVEEFQKLGKTAGEAKNQTSPLTAQAQAFALYLNPPPPPPPPRPKRTKKVEAKPTAIATAVRPAGKFKLLGTCVNKSNPALSTALVELPNKKTKWVKLSSTVEHSVIEEIKDGLIVIRSGEKLSEIESPQRPSKLTYLKKADGEESKSQETGMGLTLPQRLATKVAPAAPKSPARPAKAARRIRGALPKRTSPAAQKKRAEDAAKQKQENIKSIKGIIENRESMKISKEETERLADLEDVLKKLQEEESNK